MYPSTVIFGPISLYLENPLDPLDPRPTTLDPRPSTLDFNFYIGFFWIVYL